MGFFGPTAAVQIFLDDLILLLNSKVSDAEAERIKAKVSTVNMKRWNL